MARRFGSAIISNTDSTVVHYIPIHAYTCQGIYRYKKTTKAKTEKPHAKTQRQRFGPCDRRCLDVRGFGRDKDELPLVRRHHRANYLA